jgi:hypothetical protein
MPSIEATVNSAPLPQKEKSLTRVVHEAKVARSGISHHANLFCHQNTSKPLPNSVEEAREMKFELSQEPLLPIESHVCIARTRRDEALQMLEIAMHDPDMANRFMRLFYLFQGTQQEDFSLELQSKALNLRQTYRLQTHAKEPGLRLLALCAPGDMRENLPLDYLVEGQAIQLELLYLMPEASAPQRIPDHDVAIVAMGFSKKNAPLLQTLCEWATHWPRPLLNHPSWVFFCERERAYHLLKDIPGLVMARQDRHSRQALLSNAHTSQTNLVSNSLPMNLPLTIRPCELHAGIAFELIESLQALKNYLAKHPEQEFYVSPYLDYQNEDKQFRKFRLSLIQGVPYVSHLAVSKHWVVHYKSAEMELDENKKREEKLFMESFEDRIVKPFTAIFREIYRLIPLDYMVLDCALSPLGELIVFEIDNSAWVHDTDSEELFPYKKAIMKKTFDAFYQLLKRQEC